MTQELLNEDDFFFNRISRISIPLSFISTGGRMDHHPVYKPIQ